MLRLICGYQNYITQNFSNGAKSCIRIPKRSPIKVTVTLCSNCLPLSQIRKLQLKNKDKDCEGPNWCHSHNQNSTNVANFSTQKKSASTFRSESYSDCNKILSTSCCWHVLVSHVMTMTLQRIPLFSYFVGSSCLFFEQWQLWFDTFMGKKYEKNNTKFLSQWIV